MFWNKMSAQDVEKIVETAVAKATNRSEETIREERRCSNYLKASQNGQFKTKAGIYEYFRAYEGMTAEQALKATEIECKGRGIGESGKIDEPEQKQSMIKQIQDEALGAVLSSLKSDPMSTLQTAAQVIGGAASFGAGLIGGKKLAENYDIPPLNQVQTPKEDLPTETLNPEDLD